MSIRGLVKVTIDAPERRIDLALPERSTVAEVLPGILRHAGDDLADFGALQGGWVLRRPDGEALETHLDLAGQGVRDGEILHLAPAHQHWPELEYDDLVDAIATDARSGGRAWTPVASRWCGLIAATAALLTCLILMHSTSFAFAVAVVLMAVGVLLSRAVGDAAAAAMTGAVSLVFAVAGGALSIRLSEFGAPQLTAGGAALLLFGLLGYVGIARHTAVFAAAVTTGVLALVAGWLGGALDGTRSAAVVGSIAVALIPVAAPLAMRIGRLPKPVLPTSTADLLADAPQPPRRLVHAAVLRSAALYTGILAGLAVGLASCLYVLARSTSTPGRLLVVLVVGICLLRARLLPVVAHRVSLVVAGLVGLGCLLVQSPYTLLVFAAVAAFLGLWYARHRPGAYLARYAELAEVVLVLLVVPIVLWVLGLYSYVRGLGG
ncbi:type VII secretion integral membrane protein EccD [Kribbella aluminosa]|uniref:Type VII secretion integral membrane protein EccD n=1 Tax=Kribbella aluminosa TaxID=416017 RepID=A0ABS4USN8_9ACTN|nr:type VII secretion integral membrane protein EccD [Kribbella aluminosa]MBP2354653.1 type VII secretion integral membrane protein EccD [Kribbella aluminosa]